MKYANQPMQKTQVISVSGNTNKDETSNSGVTPGKLTALVPTGPRI